MDGNPHLEEACMRVAELTYDKADYQTAHTYFQRMLQFASSSANRITALLGMLRCSQEEKNTASVIEVATQLLEQEALSEPIRQEALYFRAKAHLLDQQFGLAVVDLTPLAKEVRTAIGAEAKYQLAYAYLQLGSTDLAEQEIMSFTQMQTSQQYWLAKSMILLADINMQRDDLFQAKQYLLALQSNYRQEDDIQTIIAEKLAAIEEAENAVVEEENYETEEESL